MPVTLTPEHLVRAGAGPDAVRLQVRGFGLVLGSLGAFFVSGRFDGVRVRRFRSNRCRVLFLGWPHLFAWRSAALAPAAKLEVPAVEAFAPPAPPRLSALPRLEVQLTVQPPELP